MTLARHWLALPMFFWKSVWIRHGFGACQWLANKSFLNIGKVCFTIVKSDFSCRPVFTPARFMKCWQGLFSFWTRMKVTSVSLLVGKKSPPKPRSSPSSQSSHLKSKSLSKSPFRVAEQGKPVYSQLPFPVFPDSPAGIILKVSYCCSRRRRWDVRALEECVWTKGQGQDDERSAESF